MINAELDLCPTYGWQTAPEFDTLIRTLRNGRERRRPRWEFCKHRYSLPFQAIRDHKYLTKLKAAFLSARGASESFLVKDYSDYRVSKQTIGIGDGVAVSFPLLKDYTFGNASYQRRILHPLRDIYTVNGVSAQAIFDNVSGTVIFDAAPDIGDVIQWSGEFRVPVRFENDNMPMNIFAKSGSDFLMNGSVDLLEVWE